MAVVAEVQQKTILQVMNAWIWWTIFAPITVPLEVTKVTVRKSVEFTLYAISLVWSAFCVLTLILAAIAVYVPKFGEKLSWLFLLPSKIDGIP